MDTAFCPHLWRAFAIRNNGDVFNCCLSKPVRIGNIYKDDLKTFSKLQIVIEARKRSLTGTLECYNGCNFIKKDIPPEKIPTHINVKYSDLKRLDLMFGEACNIACIMCKQAAKVNKSQDVLDTSVLIEHIDVEPFQDIALQGGEPLFIPECLQYMDYLEDVGKGYTILTNGLLIDEAMTERLVHHANRVIVSINAATKTTHDHINVGSRFEHVISNLRRLRNERDRAGTNLKIIGRMTITTASLHEIPLFIKKFQEFGADYINFGYDKATVPQYLSENPEFFSDLRKKTIEALKESNLELIDTLKLIYLGLVPSKMFDSKYFGAFHEDI